MKWRTETQAERLRYALGEKSVFIMPLLALLAIAILIVALGTSHAREKSLPPVAEIAEVIRFGAWQGRTGDHMLVVVRMSNGTTRTIMSSMDVLLNCHVGSRIRLRRQGALESVSPLGCAPGN